MTLTFIEDRARLLFSINFINNIEDIRFFKSSLAPFPCSLRLNLEPQLQLRYNTATLKTAVAVLETTRKASKNGNFPR